MPTEPASTPEVAPMFIALVGDDELGYEEAFGPFSTETDAEQQLIVLLGNERYFEEVDQSHLLVVRVKSPDNIRAVLDQDHL